MWAVLLRGNNALRFCWVLASPSIGTPFRNRSSHGRSHTHSLSLGLNARYLSALAGATEWLVRSVVLRSGGAVTRGLVTRKGGPMADAHR
ncbi:hypothetical protein NDU88_007376 [Pleurodeles waltl]|uniref:Secreted protein n=1 Tax=Pleurodeles waltl TaxID=8319 RepID=A0AAV7QMT4_PLEWA|nr:hypothetical protein NDU88_007376 [Pleurodeles waltl]